MASCKSTVHRSVVPSPNVSISVDRYLNHLAADASKIRQRIERIEASIKLPGHAFLRYFTRKYQHLRRVARSLLALLYKRYIAITATILDWEIVLAGKEAVL